MPSFGGLAQLQCGWDKLQAVDPSKLNFNSVFAEGETLARSLQRQTPKEQRMSCRWMLQDIRPGLTQRTFPYLSTHIALTRYF